jgi:RecQ family ATP-dependent DNA helicase
MVRGIRDLLADHPRGISPEDLLRLVQAEINPRASAAQLAGQLDALGDEVATVDGLVMLQVAAEPEPAPESTGGASSPAGPRHLVAVDLETVLRYTRAHPDGERTIFQVGAMRFGPDAAWNARGQRFDRFVELSPELLKRITNEVLRSRIEALGESAEIVLADLRAFIADADAVVAYNGRAFDFPLLDEAMTRALGSGLPKRLRQIDGLYLALAVWPVPPRRHALSRLINDDRFTEIRERLAIDLTGLIAHNAGDDVELMVDLIRFAAAEVESWPEGFASLVRSAGTASDAWQMLFEMIPGAPSGGGSFDAGEVRSTLAEVLVARGKAPLRAPAVGAPLPLDLTAVASGSVVDIDRIVALVRGEFARPRGSQREMVVAMREWLRERKNALVEAPTGTGKSFAILAVALEWLAADPRNRVVISTFTKALQRQLADDIAAMDSKGAVPGLTAISSLVKGSANRLSLAGLVRVLADITTTRPSSRRRRRGDFVGDAGFAELVIYLTLRLLDQGSAVEEWEAHSVDPVDVEPFFDSYLAARPRGPSRRGPFLQFLSQAESRDYRSTEESPAEHTSLVPEVLARHRLLVTNHALLLAHLDDFNDAARTLLVIDEAHNLEAAATNALEARYEHALTEETVAELREWIRPIPADATDEDRRNHDWLERTLRQIEAYLDLENVPNLARRTLDTAGRDPLHADALRVVPVASPVSRPVPPRDGFVGAFEKLAGNLSVLALAAAAAPRRGDRLEEERRVAIADRLEAIASAATRIRADLLAIIAPDDPAAVASNRVVWLAEQPSRGPRPRDVRFTLTSSPIELAREPDYVRLATAFGPTYHVSATLRVDGSFGFIRDRLALPASVSEITLSSPFNLEEQAKLVAFTDFPSWAEQESAAVASVAQQVGRFLGETSRGTLNGAMVLTTSRNAANTIYESMITVRGELGDGYAISSAGYLGTATAIKTFGEQGGALVGTKGLWQGVDIADPDLLRMVWVNKLPFAPFADPVIAARREIVRMEAEVRGETDPDGYSVEHYYLPLAAIELRQAVGRLIRSSDHRGVVVISDRKLAGPTRLHRRYRQVFLGSLEGMVRDDAVWGPGGGNLRSMADGWREIWDFFAKDPSGLVLSTERAAELSSDAMLEAHTQLPSVREVREAGLTSEEMAALRAAGPDALASAVLERCHRVASALLAKQVELHDYQSEAIEQLAQDRDVMAILPTSAGKSFIFQLPALALPGVTIVVSPLVALMTDQALGLNRSVGGMVRALVAPMRESNSRTGKAEVAAQITGQADLGIRVIYVSPERLCQAQFQRWIEIGVDRGVVTRIAVDEAHTFATWGDDFRPSFKRAERFLERLRAKPTRPRIIALTATATPSVRKRLRKAIFGLDAPDPAVVAEISRNPIRPELALYRRMLGQGEGGALGKQRLIEALVDSLPGHAIIYTLTVKEAKAIHAALLEHLGEANRDRVRLFHGRLTASEKESVARDFAGAPSEDDEDYRPMIVVATGAFGLGVDRKDIRAVVVASPPADLAALYQEIGRAGRDGGSSAGLMIGSGRGFRTLAFMESLHRTLDAAKVARVATAILSGTGAADLQSIAGQILEEDRTSGAITVADGDRNEALGNYHTDVVRVLAALDEDGLLEDRGDFPDRVKAVVRDDAPTLDPVADADLAALLAAIVGGIDDPTSVDIAALAAVLAPSFPEDAADPADLWVRLLDLHSLGYLDVSQQATKAHLTSVVRNGGLLPAGFADRFITTLRADERTRLVGFFSGATAAIDCINDDFRAYFEEASLPPHTCATDDVRCSGCWRAGLGGEAAVRPNLLVALTDTRTVGISRPKGPDPAVVARAVRHIERLLRATWNEVSVFLVWKTLRGEDHFWSKAQSAMRPISPRLTGSAIFGAMPGVRADEVGAAFTAIVASGRAVETQAMPRKVRWAQAIREEEAREAYRAAKQAAVAAAAAEAMQEVGDDPVVAEAEAEVAEAEVDSAVVIAQKDADPTGAAGATSEAAGAQT